MKKLFTALLAAVLLTSCASIFPPKANAYQKTKPVAGQPAREIKVGWLIWDILWILPLPIDFATGKIYKESPSK